MYNIKVQQPGMPEMGIPVTVTKVHADGTCDFIGDGVRGVKSPEPIYDDNGQVVTLTEIVLPVSETTLLRAQVQALTDRNEFLEDCIAEMATIIYA